MRLRSISDQIYGTPDHHALLRDRCTRYLASERNYFEQFVAEPFDDFLARISREGEWGDDVEIEALSEIFDVRVEIYASYSYQLMRTFHETSAASHPIRLQYVGNSHYNSLALRSGLVPIARDVRPGDIEDAAIARSRRRQEAGDRREGANEADIAQSDREVLDESIRLSRLEFEHKSDSEMDVALEASRTDWERTERKRMDEEVVDAILQQSVMEEEGKQIAQAMKESKDLIRSQDMQNPYAMYGHMFDNAAGPATATGTSSSSAANTDSRDVQYPESVYAVMSMGFPLEKCIQAYHLVGDNPEGILMYCCQALGH